MREGLFRAGCRCSASDWWSPGLEERSVSRTYQRVGRVRIIPLVARFILSKDVKPWPMPENSLSITSGLNTRGTAMRLKTAQKLAVILLVAVAISVSAVTPAYADGTDA